MTQKILVAFDNSENAMRAVAFIARSFPTDNEVLLFHVLPDTAVLCEMHSPELTDYFITQQSSFCALEDKKRQLVEDAMVRAKSVLTAAGYPEKNVRTRLDTRKKGIARDILTEAENGYDLIVMGRRGVSAIMEFFIGSVSQKVVNAAKKLPVLIVS